MTVEEVLQLHWMDAAKMSGGSYANEPSMNAAEALADIERIRLEDRLHDAKQVEFTLKDIVQPESNVRKATRAYTALSLQEKRIKELQSKLEERQWSTIALIIQIILKENNQ